MQTVLNFEAASLEHLSDMRRAVARAAAAFGADPEIVGELMIAVNEALENIIRHGYNAGPGDIEVVIEADHTRLLVHLRDCARYFDPTTVPEPDITLPLSQRPFGGMGIRMMRVFCDELRYRKLQDGRNQLTLAKQDAFPL